MVVRFLTGLSLGILLSIGNCNYSVPEISPIKIDWDYETITLLLEDYQMLLIRLERN